jgi:hypothetical protein
MHYTRTVICILLLGGVCTCATFLLALTPEQHKASDYCDGVFVDTYSDCLKSSSNIEECLQRAKEARNTCRKNSGLPMKSPPQIPKGPGVNPSGKPSPSASPTRKPLRHVDDLGNVQTQTLTSPTPKPLRHVDNLGNVQTQSQTQTLTRTSPTPRPKPSRSPSHHKG